jgi:hypothetical protein
MKIKVYASYDQINETWNVFNENRECLFYGSVESVDSWLFEHSQTHEEV